MRVIKKKRIGISQEEADIRQYNEEKIIKSMELEKIVICAFEKIIPKYDLQTTFVSANEMRLSSDKYILLFLLHSEELEMVYIEKREDGELYAYYNIDSFILYSGG